MPLIEVFEGRKQLLVCFHMWRDGKPAPEQCEGCTFFTGHANELSYLHSRDVTYATFCQGPYPETSKYRDFIGWSMPWYSARDAEEALLGDRGFGGYACYVRDGDRVFQTYRSGDRGTEAGATSNLGSQFRLNGRPTAQWSRIKASRSGEVTG